MDPNATYQRWKDAISEGDSQEAYEARQDLQSWIQKGGFKPTNCTEEELRECLSS